LKFVSFFLHSPFFIYEQLFICERRQKDAVGDDSAETRPARG